jgi:hypothetical protein
MTDGISDRDSLIDVAAGATVRFSGLIYSAYASARFEGDGEYLLDSGFLAVGVPPGAAVGNLSLPHFTQTGGSFIYDGNVRVTITDTFRWTGGTLVGWSGSSSINLAPGSTCTIDGDGPKAFGAQRGANLTMNLGGTTTWTGAGALFLGGVLENQAGATFIIDNDSRLAGSGSFLNFGTLVKTAGTGTTSVDPSVVFVNLGGTVRVESGALDFGGSYLQTSGATVLSPEATLTAADGAFILGGTLSGIGTVRAAVFNAGRIEVGTPDTVGTLTIDGDYTQTASGSLVIRFGGATPGSDFDQLVVTGRATLDGSLTVYLRDGFRPDRGDPFTVLTFGSVAGQFATLEGDGSLFTTEYDPGDVTLVAI